MKELINDLGVGALSAKKTGKLIRKKYKSITYDSVKNALSNYKLTKLYNIKANLKNYIDAVKYYENLELQMMVSLIAVLIAILNGKLALIFVAIYVLFTLFNATRERANDEYTVKCILLLEVVEDKIKSEKKKNKMLEDNKIVKNLVSEVVEVTKTTENKARKETLIIKLKNKKVLMKKKLILKKKSSIRKQKVLKDNCKLIKPQLYYFEKTL